MSDAPGTAAVPRAAGGERSGSAPPRKREPVVALAGNPNTGKTSLFNRLTGLDLKVGNYPGVTVERHEGHTVLPRHGRTRLMDVPGTYSLSSRSSEEEIAIRAIAGLPPMEAPDVAVIVVDATQLTRNLYLVLQVIEIGTPVVVALTMLDMLAARGLEVDVDALSAALGVPVVGVSGVKGTGLVELAGAIDDVLDQGTTACPAWRWDPRTVDGLAADLEEVRAVVPAEWARECAGRRDALALWALLSLDESDEIEDVPGPLRAVVEQRRAAASRDGREIDAEVIAGRYGWIDEHSPGFLRQLNPGRRTWSERVDSLALHPAAGFALFLLAMGVVFQSLFSWADPAIGAVEAGFDWLGGVIRGALPEGLFQDFLVDGVIAGAGSVVVFLPQILLLFLFIGVMEDTGYMARVSFLMDRVMRVLGLHGRAFVPMMSGFACAVPAILATRTMERRRDRLLTMMVVPLMTCAARLPVYTLIIAALFPPGEVFGFLPIQGGLMVFMYLFSTLTALLVAGVLGRTLFKGPRVPLLLELPPYRLPHLPSVLKLMWIRSRYFLTEAGTVILGCTIVLWVLMTFPTDQAVVEEFAARETWVQEATGAEGDTVDTRRASLGAEREAALLERTWGGRLGKTIEPAIAPLGFDWKIGIGLLGSFAAREVFISTMGVVYGLGDEVDEGSGTLRERIRTESHADGRPVYTPLVGISLMLFFALAAQCMSTLAAVKRETRSYGWAVFLFAYMTVLAWVVSFVAYQGGRLLGFE